MTDPTSSTSRPPRLEQPTAVLSAAALAPPGPGSRGVLLPEATSPRERDLTEDGSTKEKISSDPPLFPEAAAQVSAETSTRSAPHPPRLSFRHRPRRHLDAWGHVSTLGLEVYYDINYVQTSKFMPCVKNQYSGPSSSAIDATCPSFWERTSLGTVSKQS